MEDESSKKKKKKTAMGLNQLHNRFLTASSHSKSSAAAAAYGFLSDMKNPEQRQHDFDGPSFDFDSDSDNDSDSDSPCSAKTLENDTDGEKVLSVERSGGAEETKSVENVTDEEKVSSFELFDDCEESARIDKSAINGLDYSSSDGAEKVVSKVMNEDDIESVKQVESRESFGEPVGIIEDDVDSQQGDRHQKVKIHGRRRLCKVVVNDDDEEDDKFHDVESEFSAVVADFDSPSPAKNTTNKPDGGDEIRDILSNLSSKFEFLSIEKGKRPVKQLSTSSDSFTKESLNEHKPVKVSERIDEKTSFSSAPNRYDSSPKATATRKENINTGYVKNHVGKGVATESSVHLQKSKNVKVDDDDDDDDDCVVTSGQKFVQKVEGKGGILGDDMGLGKTMQICGFLAGLFHSKLIKRVLVVAPKTLLPHWMKELGVVNLSRITREFFGTCSKARQYELQYVLQDKGVLLTTYDIVRNNVKALSGDYDEMEDDAVTWDYMILDEGHLIKNPSTQRAKSLLAIPCAHRIIISGTPLQNNLKELWALFNFCCPELLGDKKCFKDKYESAILRGNDKNASERDKRIGSAVAQDLRNCIQPYFLRRLKSEVFREDSGNTNTAKLSKKNEIIVWLRLSRCQRQLYEAFLKSEIVLSAFDGSPLAAITILKKICDHPLLLTKRAAEDVLEGMESDLNQEDHGVAEKLAMHIADVADKYDIRENNDILSCKISFIVSLLDNLIPEGHHVLIFSQTRKMLNLIQDAIIAQGYKFLRIDGTTKASDRLKIVNDFQEGVGAPPIFLLTSQVGGLGLTLTKADRVIVADPAWNPSTDNQSVDRAYRIGQTKDVLVYRLMTCGTVEEKIYRKQIYKGGLFRSATEQKEQIRYFSAQDLRELFSLPKQGFDVSLTQQQLHEEHDSEHTMDPSLKVHTKFLESLGIAGISHHSLLFSRTAPVQPVAEEELTRIRQSTYVGHSTSRSSHEQNVDAAQFAVNPKDIVRRTHHSPNISNKLTESEIKQQINRLSQIYANKAMVARLGDNGAKIQKQISELNSELNKLRLSKTGEIETIDLSDDFNRVINI
ncbi:putative DNA helicase chromatin remodeling SNF2 family [Helianthus debilis subsp. tardiflorus]